MEITIDLSDIRRMGNMFAAAGDKAPHAVRRAINRSGDKARTRMKRALVPQTGLKAGVIARALKTKRANYASASYEIKSRGGNISLKHFGARETRKGVSAAPWNRRTIYSGVFMKGGRFPKRVGLKLGGHAFQRKGAGRTPIGKVKSGLFIPDEMITKASNAAFFGTVREHLPNDLARELLAIIGGGGWG